MDTSVDIDDQSIPSLSRAVLEHPWQFGLLMIVVCCVVTRIRTGLQANYKNIGIAQDVPRPVPVVPYWIPFVGHTISFGIKFLDFLKSTAYQVPSGIFGIKVGGGTHVVVISPSLTRELYNRPSIPMNSEELVFRFLELPFGDGGLYRAWDKRNKDELWALGKILHGFMREPFLSNAVKGTVREVENQTWNLISGNSSWVDHSIWERAGKVDVVSVDSKDGSFVAEADLFGLSRNFVGDIASTLLMGHAFMENNPDVLNDLWLFDSKLVVMMLGLPWWLMPGVPPAVGARERLIKAVTEHHRAMIDTIEGKDPGYKYNDLSDVSNVVWERLRGFHAAGVDGRTYGIGNLVLLWAMNVNANQVIFWMLFFIYANPTLLDELRQEIAPYVYLAAQPESSRGFPIQEAPRLRIDISSLSAKCPLLKGTFLETMRDVVASSSYRIASDDFTITESKEDALLVGKSRPDKYLIKKNDLICINSKVQQDNPLYYTNPDDFNPRRHWVTKSKDRQSSSPPPSSDSSSSTGTAVEKSPSPSRQPQPDTISVEYGSMRPWGGGPSMCKGRNFAEREVLTFVAAILTVWDMEPADAQKGWKHPGYQVTAGTMTPKTDLRVRMWRRRKGLPVDTVVTNAQ